MLLGTAAYMSPEQARGKEVDKRADIWAFGCVLYEMLTGRTAFGGETISDIIAAILDRAIDWTALPTETPARIHRLLRRCLEREADRRLHDIADARIEIDDTTSEPDTEQVATNTRLHWKRGWLAAALFLVTTLGLATTMYVRRPPLPNELRLEITTPPTTDPQAFALSTDGQTLVFVASSDDKPMLWLRPLNSLVARPLPDTDGASFPFPLELADRRLVKWGLQFLTDDTPVRLRGAVDRSRKDQPQRPRRGQSQDRRMALKEPSKVVGPRYGREVQQHDSAIRIQTERIDAGGCLRARRCLFLRYRRAVPARAALERLMMLDAVLATPTRQR